MNTGDIIIRSGYELRKIITNNRAVIAMQEKELAVASTITRNVPKTPYEVYGLVVRVNPEQECVDVELQYVNRTPKGCIRSIPLNKFTGREIKYLFDCSGLNIDSVLDARCKGVELNSNE